jgi:hypothetical protein
MRPPEPAWLTIKYEENEPENPKKTLAYAPLKAWVRKNILKAHLFFFI